MTGPLVPGNTKAVVAASAAIREEQSKGRDQADHLARVALSAAAPLLVSAETVRVTEACAVGLGRERDRHEAEVEGLRAELAEAKRRMLSDAAEATRYGERFREERTRRAAAESELAAVRAAGGQEKPSDGPRRVTGPMVNPNADRSRATAELLPAALVGGQAWRTGPPTTESTTGTAVGGQAEPSDAQIEAAAHTLYLVVNESETFWAELTERGRQGWLTDARAVLRAAAAVSGEQATPPSEDEPEPQCEWWGGKLGDKRCTLRKGHPGWCNSDDQPRPASGVGGLSANGGQE